MHLRKTLGGLAAVLFLGGCMVGPDYRRPAVDVPPSFRDAPEPAATNSLADLAWWDVYRDDTLAGLIRVALTNNYDAQIALSRMEQADAMVMQARSQLFPQAGYQAAADRGKNAFLGNVSPNQGLEQSSFFGSLNATWEIDLWGRVRRMTEAARAQYLASAEGVRAVSLALVSQVAQAYFELLELDLEREIASRTRNSFADSLKLFTQKLEGGVSSKLETARAAAAEAQAAASIPDLERQIAIKENQIAMLLGFNPGPLPRSRSLRQQDLPPDVPAGLPSQLLERRPDIRQAEQTLRAANAQIGVAEGDYFPRIGLTTLFGGVSTELSEITAGTASTWSFGGNVSGPLFQGGRLRGQYRGAVAAAREAQLGYRQTALAAFQEVANTLVSRQKWAEVRVQQENAVRALQEAVDVSTKRYLAGKASYYEVLEAQQQLFPAENALARTQLNQLLVVVQLYKALGGGWEQVMSLTPPAAPASQETQDVPQN